MTKAKKNEAVAESDLNQEPIEEASLPPSAMPEVTDAVEDPPKMPDKNAGSLLAKARELEAAVAELRREAKVAAVMPDCWMLNPRGNVVGIPGRLVNGCRRKGFVVCDKKGTILGHEYQPPIISEEDEIKMNAAGKRTMIKTK